MPYIKKSERARAAHSPETAGELNYAITLTINDYLVRAGLTYQACNDIVGALDNAKDEFKRRIQNPYEDTKIATNGDVYDQDLLSWPDVGTPSV